MTDDDIIVSRACEYLAVSEMVDLVDRLSETSSEHHLPPVLWNDICRHRRLIDQARRLTLRQAFDYAAGWFSKTRRDATAARRQDSELAVRQSAIFIGTSLTHLVQQPVLPFALLGFCRKARDLLRSLGHQDRPLRPNRAPGQTGPHRRPKPPYA